MNELIMQLKTRIAVLRKALAQAESKENSFPDGRLRVSTSRNRHRYYHMTEPGNPEGKYITREHRSLAEALAQKDYTDQFLKHGRSELSRLEKVLSLISSDNGDLIYQKLPEARKCLISPYITPRNLYIKEWQAKSFKANPYMPENKIYDTRRGEKVRSKSEAILADMLYELGIPYHYEMPLRLKSGGTRYPDFTLLDSKTCREIYLEHFGLLNDEDYRNNCLHKLNEYRHNDIYPGKNLIITYEAEESPLDIKGIKKMLHELLL